MNAEPITNMGQGPHIRQHRTTPAAYLKESRTGAGKGPRIREPDKRTGIHVGSWRVL